MEVLVNYVQIILSAAKTAKTSALILLAICTHESKLTNITVFNDGGSPTYGICGIKYETAQMLGYEGKPEGLLNPKENAKWAANYLRYQQVRYGDWCKAVAAYNAGKYNESKVALGLPRNLKYVRNIQKELGENYKNVILCDYDKEQKKRTVEEIARRGL